MKNLSGFVVPDGAEWKDLTINVGDTALVAVIGGMRRERSLEDCGFTRGHSDGDMALQTLRLFAHHRGTFSKRDMPAAGNEKTPFRKQVSMLRKQLKTLFPIEGEPIINHKASGRYQCAFRVSLDSDPCFPAGESWLDFCIEALDGGRVRVGVKTKEVFTATCQNRENGPAREAAVGETRLWAEYSLDRLGLAEDNGLPTAEGQTLLAFLRGGGRLERRPDDMPLLRLGQRLRGLSGIADDPFQYSDRKGAWVALFECGGARRR